MPEITVTLDDDGGAYVALVVGDAPEVRESVALDALEDAGEVPALDRLVLDYDFYGRLVWRGAAGAAGDGVGGLRPRPVAARRRGVGLQDPVRGVGASAYRPSRVRARSPAGRLRGRLRGGARAARRAAARLP